MVGKARLADYLSWRTIQELRSLDVHVTKESMIHMLRLGEGQSIDEDIQRNLKDMF